MGWGGERFCAQKYTWPIFCQRELTFPLLLSSFIPQTHTLQSSSLNDQITSHHPPPLPPSDCNSRHIYAKALCRYCTGCAVSPPSLPCTSTNQLRPFFCIKKKKKGMGGKKLFFPFSSLKFCFVKNKNTQL